MKKTYVIDHQNEIREITREPNPDELSIEKKHKHPKAVRILWSYIIRPLLLLAFLYIFICSLDLLSNAFRLLAGKITGKLAKVDVLKNPLVGLMIGLLITVLVQSSSTSTSIIITMVGASILEIRQAIFMVMGANIGTSVTNTLVAMGQVGDRQQFRRAFAGATVHDVFNWLSVLVLLPLEVVSHMLEKLTGAIVESMRLETYKDAKRDLLKTITKPLTKLIIQLDKKILSDPDKSVKADTLMKICCKRNLNSTSPTLEEIVKNETCRCKYLFYNVVGSWADPVVGGVLLIISLVLLIGCLVGLVKLLNNMMHGRIAVILRTFINSKRLGCFAGYLAILLGAGLTILVQSSSVFTSTLTPLVGTGFIELSRMFPLTLGANIGTCVTGVLAALAVDTFTINLAMQTALVHLFFNIIGIIIWYPLPFMRYVPVKVAKLLGKTSSRYRWFPVFYVIVMFLLFPVSVFGLSVANIFLPVAVVGLILLILIIVSIIKVIQRKKPHWLPEKLRNWKWLPLPLRSLEPYDRICCCCWRKCRCCGEERKDETDEEKIEKNRSRKNTADKVEMAYTNSAAYFPDIDHISTDGSTRF